MYICDELEDSSMIRLTSNSVYSISEITAYTKHNCYYLRIYMIILIIFFIYLLSTVAYVYMKLEINERISV